MSEFDIKAFISTNLERNAGMYVQDFEALPDDALGRSPSGVARSPYDFTYEVCTVNNRVAMRLQGQEPPAMDNKGWMTAPDEFKNRETAVSEFKASVEALKSAWNNVPAERIHDDLKIPNWDGATPLSMVGMMTSHIGFHCGQLNYIQTLNGDAEMHWM